MSLKINSFPLFQYTSTFFLFILNLGEYEGVLDGKCTKKTVQIAFCTVDVSHVKGHFPSENVSNGAAIPAKARQLRTLE